MKKNKLIYLSVFALSFFMFLGSVSADGCCIKENGTYTYQEPKTNNILNNYAPQISQTEVCNILKDTGSYQDVIYVKDEATCKAKNNAASAANISTTTSNYKCCYKENGVYKFSSIAENICKNNLNGDTNLTQEQCIAKNPDVCCDKTTGTVKNGLTNSECASKGYKKVAYGTCSKTVTSTQEIYGESKEDCETKLHGQYDTNTGKCTYTTSTDIDVSENNAANIQNPNNPNNPNNPSSDPTPQERNGDGSALWDNTKPAPSMEGVEININCEGIKDVLGLVKTIYNLIRYATPVVLIILGSVDFFKAVMAGKEDDIKKNQKRFVSRLILAVIVFLLLSVFELIASILSKSGVGDGDSWLSCWNSLAKILSI